jgi:hypothetical protein
MGGSGRKNAIAFYGNLAVSPTWSYQSRPGDWHCPAGPRGGVPKLCPSTNPGLDAPPPMTAVVRPPSLRMASLLPVTCGLTGSQLQLPTNRYSTHQVSVCYRRHWLLLGSNSNSVYSSASVLISLPAGDCLTTHQLGRSVKLLLALTSTVIQVSSRSMAKIICIQDMYVFRNETSLMKGGVGLSG